MDLSGKKNGRGAYLCDQVICWDKATNDLNLLEQALKCEISAQERAALIEFKPVANQGME